MGGNFAINHAQEDGRAGALAANAAGAWEGMPMAAIRDLPSPCYIVDERLLARNLEILSYASRLAGCKILLAQKSFSMFAAYPLIRRYLHGTAASSLFEARLGFEEMGGEVHIYSPAYRDDEFCEIMKYSDHIIFNSLSQWRKFGPLAVRNGEMGGRGAAGGAAGRQAGDVASRASGRMARKDAQGGAGMAAGETADRGTRADAHGGARGAARTRIECGLRVNPEYSEVAAGIYNPCAPFSRLGTTLAGLGGPGGRPASELRGEAGNELGGEAAGRGGLARARGAAAPLGERGGHGKNGAPGNGPSGPDSAGAPGNLGSLGGTDWLDALDGLDGLHFHTMCEQGVDTLARTLAAVEQKFGRLLKRVKWANFGGGHHITRPGYDVAALIGCVARFQDRYGAAVYLEPGEAVALNAGFLVATVLDTTENGMGIAILDTSAACHMPDVLEMPYRPHILGSGRPGELACTYRLGGPTCLAGDTIGDYSFDRPLAPGDRLVFTDMAHYTMVKNNTFNGVNLPSVALLGADGHVSALRRFGYEDFKGRLS